MYRHRLAPLFDPRSILVVADTVLPIQQKMPSYLAKNSLLIDYTDSKAFALSLQKANFEQSAQKDLVVLCVDPKQISFILSCLSANPPKSLIILSNHQLDKQPEQTKLAIEAWLQSNSCVLLGPRSFGIVRPANQLNLSKITELPKAGKVAIVSQSRMLLLAIMDWAKDVNVGISTAVSLGDVDSGEMSEIIEYLSTDFRTGSIVVFLDRIVEGRELSSALRKAASVKPVIVLRAGRANPDFLVNDEIFSAVVRRAGAVRVDYFVELFGALKALSSVKNHKGRKLAVLSNAMAASNLLTDVLHDAGALVLAELSVPTVEALQESLQVLISLKNPVVSYAPLTTQSLIDSLKHLLDDKGVDSILLMLAPDELSDMETIVEELTSFVPTASKPIMTCLLGDANMRILRRKLDKFGMASFRTPETALSAMAALSNYHYNQELLLQMPKATVLDLPHELGRAKALIEKVRAENRLDLTLEESMALLSWFECGIDFNSDPQDEQFSIEDNLPSVAISVNRDPVLGPWIRFVRSSSPQEPVYHEKGIELPPLNSFLAGRLIKRSQVWRRNLSKYVEPPLFKKMQTALERISEIVTELANIDSIVISPIVLGYSYLHAHDVRIRLTAQPYADNLRESGYPHMAIYPYPVNLIEQHTFADDVPWTLRPIRPEDAEMLQNFVRQLSEHSRYMRFVSMMKELTPQMLTRYTYVDYHKELALVATTHIPNPANRGLPQEIIIGFSHYLRNDDDLGAEYALVIADDWQKKGLGSQLMRKLIEAAGNQSMTYLEGFVLSKNKPMLALMTSLGFTNDPEPEDPSMRHVWLNLKNK